MHRGASWRQSRWVQLRFWILPWDSVKCMLLKVPAYSSIDIFERKYFRVDPLLRVSVVRFKNDIYHGDTERMETLHR